MTNQDYEKACVTASQARQGAAGWVQQLPNAEEIASLRDTVTQLKRHNKNLRKSHDRMAGKYGTLQQELSFAKERSYNAKLKLLVIGYLIGTVVTAVSAAVNINW